MTAQRSWRSASSASGSRSAGYAACEVAVPWDSEVSRARTRCSSRPAARGPSRIAAPPTARWSTRRGSTGPHVLRDGDVVRVGRTQLIFHAAGDDDLRRTTPRRWTGSSPSPTDSQRKVLVELCRPALERGGGAASNREIAEALFVSVETVKTHMRALFDAFEVGDVPQYHKRTELVRRALETGLVSHARPRSATLTPPAHPSRPRAACASPHGVKRVTSRPSALVR